MLPPHHRLRKLRAGEPVGAKSYEFEITIHFKVAIKCRNTIFDHCTPVKC